MLSNQKLPTIQPLFVYLTDVKCNFIINLNLPMGFSEIDIDWHCLFKLNRLRHRIPHILFLFLAILIVVCIQNLQ